MSKAEKTRTHSLRLLVDGTTSATALRSGASLRPVPTSVGELFVGQSGTGEPDWVPIINHFATTPQRLFTQSCAAILFLDAQAEASQPVRKFAICFGTGHHALDPDKIERNFGLKVALNSLTRSGLRTLDTAQLDATTMQKRVQSSRDTDLRDFALDDNRDLLRLVAGSPDDKSFARAISGRDTLAIRQSIKPDKLSEHCGRALKLFASDDYKKDFAFIDKVSPVKNSNLIGILDGHCFDELTALVRGGSSDLHLTIPEILSPEAELEIGYFGTGLKPGAKNSFAEVAIEDYVIELQAGTFASIKDMATLKSSHMIKVMEDGEGSKEHQRKLYRCFVMETQLAGSTYVLFDGEWFCIDKDFYADVQSAYSALLTDAFVEKTHSANEREFIAELDKSDDLLNIDQTKASPKGAKGANLEACDFLSKTKQFIHLKDGHSSAPLSHLWNQGLVATEAFMSDLEFRKKFRKNAKAREKKAGKAGFESLIPDGRSRPVATDFSVIFGVMRHPYKKSGELGLPFFSKVSLRAVAERLDLIGFKVELHLIRKLAGH